LLLALLQTACSGDSAAPPPAAEGPKTSVPSALVEGAWQVRMANDATRAPFEGRASWTAYFQGRRPEALAAMAGESDAPGLARLHAEYAAIYRQAAALASNATVQVYGVDRQESDPAECAWLVGVAGALLGDPVARGGLGGQGASKVSGVTGSDQAWAAWVAAGAAFPADAPAAVPAEPLTPGALPGAEIPRYSLPLRGEPGAVTAVDPSALYSLSRRHEAAALAADPASADRVARLLSPWRLAAEPAPVDGTTSLDDVWLFMSVWTSDADARFAAAVAAGDQAAVDAWADRSAYAAIAKGCMTGGRLGEDCVLDQSALLGAAIEAAMQNASGREDSFYRSFADFARVGVLRTLDRVAFALGDPDTGGRLRIHAYDRSVGPAADPLFLLSLAAWDAGNRNSLRAAEIVNTNLVQVPGLDAARVPLDALQVRLSRNSGPAVPMH
jgi:hypothetical protein